MILYFFFIFFASAGGAPLYPEIIQYYIKILHRPRIIVGDAGFEPVTFASEVGRATIELPHLCFTVYKYIVLYMFTVGINSPSPI